MLKMNTMCVDKIPMKSEGNGPETTSLSIAPPVVGADRQPPSVADKIAAKRATAADMAEELARVTEELRSSLYVVRDEADELDDRPEHPQIKQKALLMVQTALEDAIAELERDADELESTRWPRSDS